MENLNLLFTHIVKLSKFYPEFQISPEPRGIQNKRKAEEERIAAARQEKNRSKLNLPSEEAGKNKDSFPGGVVPKNLPSKRMGGRIRTRKR